MLMEKLLPYFEYKSTAEEINFSVDNYIGLNINTAKEKLSNSRIEYEIVGNGNTVISQIPAGGEVITTALSKVILYTSHNDGESISVPDLIGLSLVDAIKKAISSGMNVKLAGAEATAPDAFDIVIGQSLPPGTESKRGSVIVIRAINQKHED